MNYKKITIFMSIALVLVGSVSCSNKTKKAAQQSDSIAAIDNKTQIPDDSVITPTKSKKGNATVFSFNNANTDLKVISNDKTGTFFIEDKGKKIPLKDEDGSFANIEDCRMCNNKIWIIATRETAGMMDGTMRGTSVFFYDMNKNSFKYDIYCSEAKFKGQNVEYQEAYIKNPDAECAADFDFATLTRGIALNGKGKEASENDVIRFIKEMYNGELYNNNEFLEKYCTKSLLKQLKSAYEYDGDGYATWLFRSDAQDGPSEKYGIINVTSLSNSWYKYSYYDMGVKGTNKVKVVIDGPNIKFDKIVQLTK